jgi:ferredoxin--NADP+ reductase
MFKILEKERLAPEVVKLVVEAKEIAQVHRPGQFIILRINEEGERIPLTVADKDIEKGTITIIFQEVGKTTYHLARLEKGDLLRDLAGPLGKPTHIEKFGTTLSIGGGIGVPLLYPITKGFKENGNRIISIIGARTKELLVMEEEMKAISDILRVCTDDGSYGIHGFVTQELKRMIDEGETINLVLGVGPVPMMKALCDLTRPYGIKTYISLNPIMVDGTGMCGACRCEIGGETKYGCVDGPEFDGHKVNFDLLMKRLAMYKNQEMVSLEKYKKNIEKSSSWRG